MEGRHSCLRGLIERVSVQSRALDFLLCQSWSLTTGIVMSCCMEIHKLSESSAAKVRLDAAVLHQEINTILLPKTHVQASDLDG